MVLSNKSERVFASSGPTECACDSNKIKHFNSRGYNLKSLPKGGRQTNDPCQWYACEQDALAAESDSWECSWASVVPCTPGTWLRGAAACSLKGRVWSSPAEHPLHSNGGLGSEECGCQSSLGFLRHLLTVPHLWAWIEQVHAWLATLILCLFVKGQNMRLPNKI